MKTKTNTFYPAQKHQHILPINQIWLKNNYIRKQLFETKKRL